MERYAAIATVFLGLATVSGLLIIDTGDMGDEESPAEHDISKFDSREEFSQSMAGTDDYYSGREALDARVATDTTGATSESGAGGAVKRSSETNVQVSGVGEPDILKNTGDKIYYSPRENNYYRGSRSNTSVFDTLTPENFSESDTIPENGRMFLTNSSVIFLGENISAYDRESHELLWEQELDSRIEAARRIDGSLYFVLVKDARSSDPCPVRPMNSVSIPCTEFYHPDSGETDTTYSLVEMDTESGEVLNRNGFAGSRSNTVVYTSRNSVYLTYSESISRTELMLDFIEDEGDRYLDERTLSRIEELESYNISDDSKMNEIQRALRNYYRKTGDYEQARKELQNGAGNYTAERKRDLSSTIIARFDTDLELESQGEVPGRVNDRYSLDESDQGLRVSTTVGESWRFSIRPENDLYTLDENLEQEGSVTGMGLNERIYSTRYLDDRAYVVTFRRIDPFHIIDVSDHQNPELKGELKLPGFSSYLHPLQEDRILGVGEEDGTVKAVIFDVEDDDPEIVDSKVLDDHYSEISNSPHAFQIDRENKVFFLPGSEGGHFFSYEDGLEEMKKVDLEDAKRAAFVNQNFYVFNDHNATVVDIKSWETIREIQFNEEDRKIPVEEPRIVR